MQHFIASRVDPIAIVTDFSRMVLQDLDFSVRNRRKHLRFYVSEKFRASDSSREVQIKADRNPHHPHRPPQVQVRLLEHEDRFRVTGNTRQVKKTVRLELNAHTAEELKALYAKLIKPWLITTEESVRVPEVPMPVRMNSTTPVDILMPAAFEIASVIELVANNQPFYRFQSADKSCYYDIPHADWIFTKHSSDFRGSFVVTHCNGERLIIAADVFHVQFFEARCH